MVLVLGSSRWSTSTTGSWCARFPHGRRLAGGGRRARSATAGSFLPIGALIVDFALTITISIAAAVSALIAYVPGARAVRDPARPRPARVRRRADLVRARRPARLRRDDARCSSPPRSSCSSIGFVDPAASHGRAPTTGAAGPARGRRAPLLPGRDGAGHGHRGAGDLDRPARPARRRGSRRFARGTLVLTIVIVGCADDRASTALAVRLHVGIPRPTRPRSPTSRAPPSATASLFALFQAPARCCCWRPPAPRSRPGPACSRRSRATPDSAGVGILPRALGHTNRHHTPVLVGRASYLAVSAVDPARSRRPRAGARAVLRRRRLRQLPRRPARDGALLAPRGQRAAGRRQRARRVAVAFTLVVNLARGYPLLSLLAMLIIAAPCIGCGCAPDARLASSRSSGSPRRTADVAPRHLPLRTSARAAVRRPTRAPLWRSARLTR